METDEVRDRPLDPFVFPYPDLTFIGSRQIFGIRTSKVTPHKCGGRLANGFFVRCKCKFRRFTGGKSRNLYAADGGKDIARRAAELCGGALI